MTRADVDDADLAALADCARGSETALADLHGRYAAACFGLALSILRDRDYAQDVVQEAYLNLWRLADRFDSRQSSVRSWLLMLTRSRAIDRVRHEERRTTTPLPAGHDRADEGPGPEAQAIVAGLVSEVREALGQLSPPKREALVLAYWGGYTQREIAVLTDTALGTVKTRMMRALIDLRPLLEPGREAPRVVSSHGQPGTR